MQVFELADELGVRSVDVLDACDDAGMAGKGAGSELTDDEVKRVRFAFNQRATTAVMARAMEADRSSAPVLAPIADPTPPQHLPPPPGWATPTPPSHMSKGMHPLIKRSIWHFALAQVVPCIGLYFLVSSLVLAGKGRRQIAWSNARYEGDTAGLVIQILAWAEIAFIVVVLLIWAVLSAPQ
jgi:hypothetical protein